MDIMSTKFFIFVALLVANISAEINSDMFLNEVRSLSQLPMDKLIGLRSAFSDKKDEQTDLKARETDFEKASPTSPLALPLKRANKKPVRRHDDYWQDGGSKSSKISRVFQLSITALSFFAFGGYLLTLIITAIRRNTAAATAGNVIFLQGLQPFKRPKRGAEFFDPIENDFNTERLYRGMVMLSEGYAQYN